MTELSAPSPHGNSPLRQMAATRGPDADFHDQLCTVSLVGLRRVAVVRYVGIGAAREGLWRDEGNGYRAPLMSPGPGFAGPSS